MKKNNYFFLCECGVILALLLVIAFLIKDDEVQRVGKESLTPKGVMEEISQDSTITTVRSVQNVQSDQESNKTKENKSIEDDSADGIISVQEKIALEDQIQIVVFGDSIWNAERGENGISEQVEEALDVKIYNCAIGGTAAAVKGESTEHDQWTSQSFNGMMYVARNRLSAEELIGNEAAYEEMKEVDFANVDYVIVSYGLNDYFSDIPIHPQEYYDMTSYVGALRHGIQKMREEYPQLKFILTSPTYCSWFEGERQFGLDDYVEAARGVAAEMDTYFLDMYHALGKNPQEKSKYLADGVHLTDEGLTMYANSVIDFLKNLPKES